MIYTECVHNTLMDDLVDLYLAIGSISFLVICCGCIVLTRSIAIIRHVRENIHYDEMI